MLYLLYSLCLQNGFETGFVFRIDTSGSACGMNDVSGDAAAGSHCGRHRLGSNGFGFVAQSAPDGTDALGCAGSGMGLWGDGTGLDCVSPALALRVDTHVGLRVLEPPPQVPLALRNWSEFTPLRSEPVSHLGRSRTAPNLPDPVSPLRILSPDPDLASASRRKLGPYPPFPPPHPPTPPHPR